MTWELVLQSFTVGLAAIGSYFIYDLISEFKMFKKDTKTDVDSLKLERSSFVGTVRNAELSIGLRVNEVQKIHNDFSLNVSQTLGEINVEMQKFKLTVDDTAKKVEKLDSFLVKSFQISQKLHQKIAAHDEEIKGMKVQMGDTTIFKSRK